MIVNRQLPPVVGRAIETAARSSSPMMAVPSGPVGLGQGRTALLLADQILARDAQLRQDVTPEMEPYDPSLSSGQPAQFDDQDLDEVPEEEMEPYDPTIESALRVEVSQDADGAVTITPDDGETLDASDMGDGDIAVHVSDDQP